MEKEIVSPSLSLSAPDQHHLGFRTRASAMSLVSGIHRVNSSPSDSVVTAIGYTTINESELATLGHETIECRLFELKKKKKKKMSSSMSSSLPNMISMEIDICGFQTWNIDS